MTLGYLSSNYNNDSDIELPNLVTNWSISDSKWDSDDDKLDAKSMYLENESDYEVGNSINELST